MTAASRWLAFYEELPGGQFRITGSNLAAFESSHPDRVLVVSLAGQAPRAAQPDKVLLLDIPLRLEEKQPTYDAYYLRRIPLKDLPGWMPTAAPMGEGHRFLSLKECRLKTAIFKAGHVGQAGVEITLDYKGETFKAWITGLPVPLLKCAVATLNQDGAKGQQLGSLQDIRLVGAEGS
jgi:hypothetical protein